jgi:ferredoxin-NADP reductase
MTSLQLLLWIAAIILLQLAIYLGIGFGRHWMDYQSLRHKVAELDIVLEPGDTEEENEPQATPPAWTGLRAFKVTRKQTEDAAQSICSFELVPEDGQGLPEFLPGQFLTFSLEVPKLSGGTESVTRCYSLSDAPAPDHYRVSVKRVPAPIHTSCAPGRSSNFFHDHVAVGSVLQVRAPAGHFYIDRSETPVVLIGGGVGITPLLSMLNRCLAKQPGREMWLFYGVRHSTGVVMRSHLQALAQAYPNFHLHLCLSDPLPHDMGAQSQHQHHGRVDVTLLRQCLPLKPYHFYICGPAPMLQTLVPALEEWGVPESRIHFEAFGPVSIPRRQSAATGQTMVPTEASVGQDVVVTFVKSGKKFPWHGAAGSLLDFAEANGISVNSGCRAGGCGSCQTTIASGEVVYRQSPDFDPEPGTCLLCVCAPKTSITLEA